MSWAKQSKARRAQVVTSLLASASSCPIVDTQAYIDAAALLRQADEPAPKGYPKSFALQCLIVEGTGPFPMAMLARDSAFPASERDAVRMTYQVDDFPPQPRRVELRRVIGAAKGIPHVARWLSFGWAVVWYGPEDKRVDALAKLSAKDAEEAKPTNVTIAWEGIKDPDSDIDTTYDGGTCDIVNRNNGWMVCFTPTRGVAKAVTYTFNGAWNRGHHGDSKGGTPLGLAGSVTRREARLFAERLIATGKTT